MEDQPRDLLSRIYGGADPPCTATVYASREEWLAARRDGIGGSDAPAVLGLSPYATPLRVYHEKIGMPAEELSPERAEFLRWGLLLEQPIAMAYFEATLREVVAPPAFTIFRSVAHPHRFATVDRIVFDKARGAGILEIKNVGPWMADKWEDGVPDEFLIQHQHQLAVMGLSWGSVAALIAGQRFAFVDIDRDDGLIDIVEPKIDRFWDDIQHQREPKAEAGDSDLLKRLYPETTGEIITLDADFIALDEERTAADAALKEAERRKETASNRIKAALGDAAAAILPNGVTYTYKRQTRSEHVVKATAFRVLRRSGTKLKKQSDAAAKMPRPASEHDFMERERD